MESKLQNSLPKFHVSLNVSNMERAVGFYEALIGMPPAKRHDDYAKFEMEAPPLVLALQKREHKGGGAINHFGFRVPHSEALVDVQRRLETCGFATYRQDGVECCYARQTKFWAPDPDGTLWEIYVLEADIAHHGSDGIDPRALAQATTNAGCCS